MLFISIPVVIFIINGLLLNFYFIPNYSHIVSKDIQWVIYGLVSCVIGAAYSYRRYSLQVLKQPIQTARAKVIKKFHLGRGDGFRTGPCILFFLADKSKVELIVSRKQYKALKKMILLIWSIKGGVPVQ